CAGLDVEQSAQQIPPIRGRQTVRIAHQIEVAHRPMAEIESERRRSREVEVRPPIRRTEPGGARGAWRRQRLPEIEGEEAGLGGGCGHRTGEDFTEAKDPRAPLRVLPDERPARSANRRRSGATVCALPGLLTRRQSPFPAERRTARRDRCGRRLRAAGRARASGSRRGKNRASNLQAERQETAARRVPPESHAARPPGSARASPAYASRFLRGNWMTVPPGTRSSSISASRMRWNRSIVLRNLCCSSLRIVRNS